METQDNNAKFGVGVYEKTRQTLRDNIPAFYILLTKYKMIVKYAISGGTAAVVDIGALFIFTDIFEIWYLLSAVLAFILAFFISFGLQKFWTFRDNEKANLHVQMTLYFVVSAINLGINSGLMYGFVDGLGIHYILAQLIAGLLIATESFLVYRYLIFKS